MQMYASFDGIEIPKIVSVDIGRTFVGERARTAGGKLRSDAVVRKRVWTLQTAPLTRLEIRPLLAHLESTLYAEGAFWLKEFGSPENTVFAMVNPEEMVEEIVPFGKDGVWHSDGRKVTLVIEEV